LVILLNEWRVDEYDCAADFTLLGKYLVVTDNSNYGGVNVRFDGVYTKKTLIGNNE
jgi:hypothetical protein